MFQVAFLNNYFDDQIFYTLDCVPRFLVARVPEIFTGLCTVTLAAERYILVIMPFKHGLKMIVSVSFLLVSSKTREQRKK